LEKQTQALNVQIQDWKGNLEMTKVQLSKPIHIPPIKMHNRVQKHFMNQCVYFPFRIIILFGVILPKIHVFIKRNFQMKYLETFLLFYL
jgi:hypothetical protein